MHLNYRKGLMGCFLLMLVILGCSQKRVSSLVKPDQGTTGSDPAISQVLSADPGSESPLTRDPTGVLKLRQALSLALIKSPELASASWEVRAAEARELQSGLLPNPEVDIEIEDFGGTQNRSGFEAATTTLKLSQLIELGGKRGKRTHVAFLEKELSGWDYKTKRLDVLTDTAKAFVGVLAAQAQVFLTQDLVRISEQTFDTVSERVKAGKVSPLEETKSMVALANTRIEGGKAISSLKAARKKLSSAWGQAEPTFDKVDGTLEMLEPIPPAEQLENLVSQNPDIARRTKEIEQRTAIIETEKAKRIPDLTVSGGVRRFNETDDHAFVVGLSFPLPLFDRNQGGILEAQQKLAKTKEESRAAAAKAYRNLGESYAELSSSYEAAMSLKKEVLPAGELAFRASSEGYRQGKFDFLEFLDAQRTLFEARGKYFDTLATYHNAAADIERLIGVSLEDVKKSSGK